MRFLQEYDQFSLATSYFDLREYDRAAFFLKDCVSPKCYFLYMYSRYLADEKRKLDKASDSIGPPDHLDNEHLKTIRIELGKKHANKELDGYSLYLYGVVLKKLDLLKDSLDVLLEAIEKEPLHWGTWQELVPLITDREMLLSLRLPSCWIKQFFIALVYLELQLNEESLKIYQDMEENGFHKSTYIVARIAVAKHNMRDVDAALTSFNELNSLDPYRLEDMDILSNLLYVKEMRHDLAHLAHKCCDIDKYRVETCCVIGNYYSLRSQHEKAVLYFQRSIKLNPLYLSAWTLMGHEYMEMKNTNAAIQAYRQALEINKRDYRAWYGLGQTYEILKMPYYSLYYYRNAQRLRPNDSRMIMGLGEAYEKLDRLQEAKKCFWKAHRVGDIEGAALLKLAKLHARLGEEDQAAGAYNEFVNEANALGLGKSYSYEGLSEAYIYLANFYVKHENLDAAYQAAQICSEYTETREEAKAVLKHIQQLRQERPSIPSNNDIRMDDTFGSIPNDSFQSHNNTPVMNFPPVMNLRFNTP
ncbi:Anaphase-promoting complex subunit 23 [Mactra antiquata]